MRGAIVGREAELTAVEAFLDRPVDGPRALVLEGDPGIGKSTLWQAGVEAALRRSFRVLSSRPAETERSLPYVVLGDLFEDSDPITLATLPPPRRHAFEAALLREETDHRFDSRVLGVAIHTLVPALAAGKPLVLAIDDDQWMDPSSAATLMFALRRLQGQRVLLLLSRRTIGQARADLAEAIDAREVEHLHIGPLSVGAIQSLLRDRLDVALSRPTLLRVHEVSGGNPFYALELARAHAAAPGDLSAPLAVPPSLEHLVSSRLESLDATVRDALLLIAAHGRMPSEMLLALEVPIDLLDSARSAKVVESVGDIISFSHPLLASAVYQGAPRQERRIAHGRLALVLNDAVERAHHLALSTDGPDEALAATLEEAVSEARRRGMPIAAAELAEHALRLTPSNAIDAWHRRAMTTAGSHLEAGEPTRAREILDTTIGRTAGAQQAEALALAAELRDPGAAVALLRRALPEAAGAPAVEAAIHTQLAATLNVTKERALAEHHAEAALELAERLNDDSFRAAALSILALLRFQSAEPNALELAERAHELATTLDRTRRARSSLDFVLTHSRLNDRARTWLQGELRTWGDRDEQVRYELSWNLGLVEVWSGRWESAKYYADQVAELGGQYGESAPDHLPLALIALHRGEFDVARGHSRRALSLAPEHVLPQHLGVLAICDLWTGNAAASLSGFAHAEAACDVRHWNEPHLRWWRAEYVEALLQLGRIGEADRLTAQWESVAERVGREQVVAQALRCRGQIAAARGDLPTSVELLSAAVERLSAVDDPFNRGRALLALGIVSLRARQKRAAREALDGASAAFDALGARSWADVARAELARVGGRQRIEGLSPSERRVAELVAEGRTNREIASALFLGERTVASHLTHIYAKLGLRSRTELVRRMPPPASEPIPASKVPTS